MARSIVGAIFVAVLTGCATTPPRVEHGQAPRAKSAAPEGKRTPLLGGRLAFRIPDGARILPRRTSIMAAEQSSDEETRVVLVPGQGDMARFVMMADEVFALGTGDVVADARHWLVGKGEHGKLEPLVAGPGLHVAAFVPEGQRSGSPLCVLELLVERADRTTAEVGFYILPEMAGERARWTARARSIAGTLTAGEHALALSAEHRIDLGEKRVLVVRSPAPSVLTSQPGPDFLVLHLRTLGHIGDLRSAMGVYIGGYPSYQFEQAGVPAAQVQKVAGKLLGHDVQWMRWTARNVVMLEAMTKLDAHEILHVFAHGSAPDADALKTAAEQMTLTGP